MNEEIKKAEKELHKSIADSNIYGADEKILQKKALGLLRQAYLQGAKDAIEISKKKIEDTHDGSDTDITDFLLSELDSVMDILAKKEGEK